MILYLASAGLLFLAAIGVWYFAFFQEPDTQERSLDPSKFEFSSNKVIDAGVPNTVIFDYDASAALSSDSIFIQQSWDKTLSRQVSISQRQHSSIYYYPGYFQAKLRVNDLVVKEHNLYIKSLGWLPVVEQMPEPVYFAESDARHDGVFGVPIEKIREFNVELQPESPWTGYYYVNELGDSYSDDFVFQSELKNDYSEGSSACQYSEVILMFEGGAIVIPLSIKGCVSNLNFLEKNSEETDLLALGVDFSDWVKVRLESYDGVAKVFVNEKEAMQFELKMAPKKIVGVAFRFRGTGSLNAVKLSKNNGKVQFEENF